jgi:hypothetical protein
MALFTDAGVVSSIPATSAALNPSTSRRISTGRRADSRRQALVATRNSQVRSDSATTAGSSNPARPGRRATAARYAATTAKAEHFQAFADRQVVYLRQERTGDDPATYLTEIGPDDRRIRQVEVAGDGTAIKTDPGIPAGSGPPSPMTAAGYENMKI